MNTLGYVSLLLFGALAIGALATTSYVQRAISSPSWAELFNIGPTLLISVVGLYGAYVACRRLSVPSAIPRFDRKAGILYIVCAVIVGSYAEGILLIMAVVGFSCLVYRSRRGN